MSFLFKRKEILSGNPPVPADFPSYLISQNCLYLPLKPPRSSEEMSRIMVLLARKNVDMAVDKETSMNQLNNDDKSSR